MAYSSRWYSGGKDPCMGGGSRHAIYLRWCFSSCNARWIHHAQAGKRRRETKTKSNNFFSTSYNTINFKSSNLLLCYFTSVLRTSNHCNLFPDLCIPLQWYRSMSSCIIKLARNIVLSHVITCQQLLVISHGD